MGTLFCFYSQTVYLFCILCSGMYLYLSLSVTHICKSLCKASVFQNLYINKNVVMIVVVDIRGNICPS